MISRGGNSMLNKTSKQGKMVNGVSDTGETCLCVYASLHIKLLKTITKYRH